MLPEIVAHRGDAEHFPENTPPRARCGVAARPRARGIRRAAVGRRRALRDPRRGPRAHDARDRRRPPPEVGPARRRGCRRARPLRPRACGHGACRGSRRGRADGGPCPRARLRRGEAREPRAPRARPLHGARPRHARAGARALHAHLLRCRRRAPRARRGRHDDRLGARRRPGAAAARARPDAARIRLLQPRRLAAGRPLPAGRWTWVIYEVTDAEQALDLAARGAAMVESMAPLSLAAALAAREPLPA